MIPVSTNYLGYIKKSYPNNTYSILLTHSFMGKEHYYDVYVKVTHTGNYFYKNVVEHDCGKVSHLTKHLGYKKLWLDKCVAKLLVSLDSTISDLDII